MAQLCERNKYIPWTNKKLRFTDFEFHSKDSLKRPGGGSQIDICLIRSELNGKIIYSVISAFFNNQSWLAEFDTALLKHEQLHFDITELYSRIIRSYLSKINYPFSEHTINNKIDSIKKQMCITQDLYDSETLHGALIEKQIEWELRIHFMVNSYYKYSKQYIFIVKNRRH